MWPNPSKHPAVCCFLCHKRQKDQQAASERVRKQHLTTLAERQRQNAQPDRRKDSVLTERQRQVLREIEEDPAFACVPEDGWRADQAQDCTRDLEQLVPSKAAKQKRSRQPNAEPDHCNGEVSTGLHQTERGNFVTLVSCTICLSGQAKTATQNNYSCTVQEGIETHQR